MKDAKDTIAVTQHGAASAEVEDQSLQPTSAASQLQELMVQGEADIASGRVTPQDRVFADLRAYLTADE